MYCLCTVCQSLCPGLLLLPVHYLSLYLLFFCVFCVCVLTRSPSPSPQFLYCLPVFCPVCLFPVLSLSLSLSLTPVSQRRPVQTGWLYEACECEPLGVKFIFTSRMKHFYCISVLIKCLSVCVCVCLCVHVCVFASPEGSTATTLQSYQREPSIRTHCFGPCKDTHTHCSLYFI